jgi:short-subunit dehydrogenase
MRSTNLHDGSSNRGKRKSGKERNQHKTVPNQSVYSGTKFAERAISEGLRQEAGDKLRVTIISPGFVRTNFAEGVTNPEVKAQQPPPGTSSRCRRMRSPALLRSRSSDRPILM